MQTIDELVRKQVFDLINGRTSGDLPPPEPIGRRALVSRQHLPREIHHFYQVDWITLCEKWGMKILGSPDALFFAVEMPQGWQLRPAAEESLWLYLFDDRSRQRAAFFYREHHPDRSATLYLNTVYSIHTHYDDPTDSTVRIIAARRDATVFREFGRVRVNHPRMFNEVERIQTEARQWFDEHYPLWRDPFAYWGELP